MGGTFDPIHIGHLFIAEDIKEKLKLDKVIFIPNGTPPHKKAKTADNIRFEMTKIAINKNDNFIISDIEIKRKKYSYTIDTLKELKQKYLEDEFYFILGSDSIMEIHKWKDYKEIFKFTNIVCYMRKGFDISKVKLEKELYSKVIFEDSIIIDISSTMIRHRVKNNKSIRYIVPDEIINYIEKNSLYRNIY